MTYQCTKMSKNGHKSVDEEVVLVSIQWSDKDHIDRTTNLHKLHLIPTRDSQKLFPVICKLSILMVNLTFCKFCKCEVDILMKKWKMVAS